jgi:hypothetical protein
MDEKTLGENGQIDQYTIRQIDRETDKLIDR